MKTQTLKLKENITYCGVLFSKGAKFFFIGTPWDSPEEWDVYFEDDTITEYICEYIATFGEEDFQFTRDMFE